MAVSRVRSMPAVPWALAAMTAREWYRGDDLQPRRPGDGAEVHGAGEGIAVDKGLFAAVGLLGRPQQGGDSGHLFLHGGDLKGGLLVGVR